MKNLTIILSAAALSLFMETNAQTCTASFTMSKDTTGVVSVTNTSGPFNPTIATAYNWLVDPGNITFTTATLAQTFTFHPPSNGIYTISLHQSSDSCGAFFHDTMTYMAPNCWLVANCQAIGGSTAWPNPAPTVSFINTSFTVAPTTYTWNFGDGNTSNLSYPTHSYSANGYYGYTLTAETNPTCTAFFQKSPFDAYGGPTYICAYIPSLSHTLGAAGQTTFNVSHTNPNSSTIWWQFGDSGPQSALAAPTRTYFNGAYTPSVYIMSGSQCGPWTLTTSITVTSNPCTANAAYSYTTLSGGVVQFAVNSLTTSNISYYWNFGDGVYSILANPLHTFPSAGNYTVLLLSYNNSYSLASIDTANKYFHYLPCKDINNTNVSITNIPCIANPNFSIISAGSPHYYYVIPSFPYNISSSVWNWGDGSSSSILYDSHTYSASGTYDVCLTVTASCGSTATACYTQFLARSKGDMLYLNVIPPGITNGIEEQVISERSFVVYPNPTDGSLFIRIEDELVAKELTIFDLTGKEVSRFMPQEHDRLIALDLSSVDEGLYFLRLRTDSGMTVKKFVVAK
jgi:PKD repeat protein